MAADDLNQHKPPVLDRGRWFYHPPCLIIAVFHREVFQQTDRDDPTDRPSQSCNRLPEGKDQGILQPIIPATLEGLQSMPEGGNKNQPGTHHSIRGKCNLVIPTQAYQAPREDISLVYRFGYLPDLFPVIRTPTASHTITSPAFRWKRPFQTTPHQLV